jgi:hypothetical protein
MPADPADIEAALLVYTTQLGQLHSKALERDYWCRQPIDASAKIQALNAEIALARGDAQVKRLAVRTLMELP